MTLGPIAIEVPIADVPRSPDSLTLDVVLEGQHAHTLAQIAAGMGHIEPGEVIGHVLDLIAGVR